MKTRRVPGGDSTRSVDAYEQCELKKKSVFSYEPIIVVRWTMIIARRSLKLSDLQTQVSNNDLFFIRHDDGRTDGVTGKTIFELSLDD